MEMNKPNWREVMSSVLPPVAFFVFLVAFLVWVIEATGMTLPHLRLTTNPRVHSDESGDWEPLIR